MKLKFTTNVLPVFISKEPAIPAQGPPPRDDFYGSSCPLGYSWICTPDKQNPLACPLGLTSVCPGVNQPTQASAGPSHCTCLPTDMVEQSLAYGRHPLGRCHSGCVCVPPLCTSGISWIPGKSPVTPSVPKVTPLDVPDSILLVCTTDDGSLTTEVIGTVDCPIPEPNMLDEHTVTFVTHDNIVISCENLCDYSGNGYHYKTVCEALDLEAQTWRPHSNISQYVRNPSVVNIPSGIFIIGGNDYETSEATDTTWFLPTGSTNWEKGPTLPGQISGVQRHCSVAIGEDSFLILGGSFEYSAENSIIGFDIVKNRWDRLWGKLNIARMDHACVNLENRKIIVAGGYADSCGDMDSTEVIDIAAKTVRKVGPLPEKRSKLGMAIFGSEENKMVLVFGGHEVENTIHLWNDTTEAWQNYDRQTSNKICSGAAVRSELICRAEN